MNKTSKLVIPESSQKILAEFCKAAGINLKHAMVIYDLGAADGAIAMAEQITRKAEAVHA